MKTFIAAAVLVAGAFVAAAQQPMLPQSVISAAAHVVMSNLGGSTVVQ